jgi:hypothetical protein
MPWAGGQGFLKVERRTGCTAKHATPALGAGAGEDAKLFEDLFANFVGLAVSKLCLT